jgi:hypothetical protein
MSAVLISPANTYNTARNLSSLPKNLRQCCLL